MFKLSNLDTESAQEQGAWMHIIDPATGEPAYADLEQEKPVRIKYKGWLSQDGKEIGINGRNKLVQEAVKKGKKKDEPVMMSVADLEENAKSDAETLTKLAIDWENIIDENGKEIKFNKETFKNVALNHLELRRQSLEFLNDQKAFFAA